MAVTSRKDQNGNYLDTNGVQYTPGQNVTQAQQKMQETQAQQPAEYKPGQSVQAAQQAMTEVQGQKPQGYNSKYGAALDNILTQIQNPEKVKYSFNGDEMFKYFADLYTQKGKQASMDAMGQAAALTGGYGNSYGQQVGNQAYDQYLLNLYDKGMELQQQAYDRYKDQRADQYNQYGVLSGEEGKEYDRYNDEYDRWLQEQNYATDRYDTERNVDYGMYRDTVGDWKDNRDYHTNVYNTEADRDYNRFADQRDYNEQVRQFDESLNWERMSSEQKYAAEYALTILQNGQMPSEELLLAAGLSAEDAQKMMAQLAAAGGGGRNNSNKNGKELTPQQKADLEWENTKNKWIANYTAEAERLAAEREEEIRKKAAKGPATTGTRMINYNTKTYK